MLKVPMTLPAYVDQHGVACAQAGADGGFAGEAVAAYADVAGDGDDLAHRSFLGIGHACRGHEDGQGGDCKAKFHGGSLGDRLNSGPNVFRRALVLF